MSSNTLQSKGSRKVYIDAMRILAAFFVIFNHTRTNGFFLFAEREWGSPAFWIYMFFSIFCKVSVPLFLMISGALMLHRDDEPLCVLWKKRIGKILLIILVFTVGNYAFDWFRLQKSSDLAKVLKTICSGNIESYYFWCGHLWYLYAYIGYLCCLPFLRSLVKNLKNQYFFYMIGIVLVIQGIIPAAEYLMGNQISFNGSMQPGWLASQIVVYPCIGYFLEHRITVRKRDLLWLWMANFAAIALTGLLIYKEALATQVLNAEVSQGFHSIFVLINCITVFLTAKYCFTNFRIPGWLQTAIVSLGQCTFGIYLIHIMIQESEPIKNLLVFLVMYVNSLLACFIQCGCVMMIGYVIVLVLRKVPLLGKLLS